MRSKAHFQPRMEKTHLIDEVNDLLKDISGDESNRLDNAERMSNRDLNILIHVLNEVKDKRARAAKA